LHSVIDVQATPLAVWAGLPYHGCSATFPKDEVSVSATEHPATRRVVFNQKGGVGKSTITCNLAAISAASGQRTLVIDLDPQGNSSHYLLGEEADTVEPTVIDFFRQMVEFTIYTRPLDEFIHPTRFENLFILPARPQLEELQSKLESRYKIYKLRDALNALEGFDAIYIDTPPAMGFFTRSALIAADKCLIPFDCDSFSRQAIYSLLGNVQEIVQDHNPDLLVEGVVVNQFQARARLPLQLVDELKAEGLPVLESFLSSSVKVRESHEVAMPLIHLAPQHKLTLEYLALHEGLVTQA